MATCIFCDQPAKSREHLWPVWTLKLGSPNLPITGQRPGKPDTVIPGPDPQLKAKIVCTDCNTGWMSRLESQAGPVMKSLALDISRPVDPVQQAIIAKWSVKTAMVFEGARREEPQFYTPDERRAMKESLTEPLLTGVWMGRFVSQTTHVSAGVELIVQPFTYPLGLVRVIKICALLLQVLSLKIDPRLGFDLREDPRLPWPDLMTQIWAPKRNSVQWPPARSLTDAQFPRLLRRFKYSRSKS